MFLGRIIPRKLESVLTRAKEDFLHFVKRNSLKAECRQERFAVFLQKKLNRVDLHAEDKWQEVFFLAIFSAQGRAEAPKGFF